MKLKCAQKATAHGSLFLVLFTTFVHGGETIPEESLTLEQLVNLSETELGKIDIAAMNLAVAAGLPGSQNIDRKAFLKQLDYWADYVAFETLRHKYQFDAHPEEFNNSWGDFCMLVLTNTLQRSFGVRYNPDQITPMDDPTGFDFTRSQDLFINGLLQGTGGTCTSMPVIYIAVGRRLGYPLKLATSPSHSFLRWDDPNTGERFNIEGTARGFFTPTDEELGNQPHPGAIKQFEFSNYLESLSPREELAVFLTTRADCLESNRRLLEADRWYRKALELAPRNPTAKLGAESTGRRLARWRAEQELEAVYQRHERQRRAHPIPGMSQVRIPTAHSVSVRGLGGPMGRPSYTPNAVRALGAYDNGGLPPGLGRQFDPIEGVPMSMRPRPAVSPVMEEIMREANPWNYVPQDEENPVSTAPPAPKAEPQTNGDKP